MTTPVSAATPTSAINPTATATDKLNPTHHISHTPPTNEKGTESMRIRDTVTKLNIDVRGELAVLGANPRRPWCKTLFGDFSQGDGAAMGYRSEILGRDCLRIAAEAARIPDGDRIPLRAPDSSRHRLCP